MKDDKAIEAAEKHSTVKYTSSSGDGVVLETSVEDFLAGVRWARENPEPASADLDDGLGWILSEYNDWTDCDRIASIVTKALSEREAIKGNLREVNMNKQILAMLWGLA